jgi:hypothetical protein
MRKKIEVTCCSGIEEFVELMCKPGGLTLEDRILHHVRGGADTFAVLGQRLGAEMDGDHGMFLGPDENNILIWGGVSAEFSNTFRSLIAQKKIIPAISSVLVYAIDGVTLNFPIATQARKYKAIHWLPVSFTAAEPGAFTASGSSPGSR